VTTDDEVLTRAQAVRVLTDGELTLEGRLVDASNVTLRAFASLDEATVRCVYKPIRGERPLWDFPDGTLAAREVAAYVVSEATGWSVVPPTVMRDGPLGPGACQLWIDEPEEATPLVGFVPADEVPRGWLPIADAQDDDGREYLLAHADAAPLARMALFDVVVNNADRKGGHVLPPVDGHLYGVDHGVCFHVDDKLRTVLWGWIGRPVPARSIRTLTRVLGELNGELGARLCALLSPDEVAATTLRLERLLADGVFPGPPRGGRAMPWPPI
jgi:uncharacterized repeat protein (TIGR03843 family)